MSTGFLFPGQGSQKLGMLADIPEMYMERLENVTGYRLVDKEENYQDTVFIQLALLTKAVFYLDEMEKTVFSLILQQDIRSVLFVQLLLVDL